MEKVVLLLIVMGLVSGVFVLASQFVWEGLGLFALAVVLVAGSYLVFK